MLSWEELDTKYQGVRFRDFSSNSPVKSLLLSVIIVLAVVLALHVFYDRRVSLHNLLSFPDKRPEILLQAVLYGILIALPLKSIVLFAREHSANVAYSLFFPTLLIAQTGSCYMSKALSLPPSMFLFSEWIGLFIGGILTWNMT